MIIVNARNVKVRVLSLTALQLNRTVSISANLACGQNSCESIIVIAIVGGWPLTNKGRLCLSDVSVKLARMFKKAGVKMK